MVLDPIIGSILPKVKFTIFRSGRAKFQVSNSGIYVLNHYTQCPLHAKESNLNLGSKDKLILP
jgi:hypothetical protein